MHSTTAHGLHDQVAGALQAETTLHRAPVALGELDGVGAAEEVRRVEQVDVQGVALDPLAAVQQPPQGGDALVDLTPQASSMAAHALIW